MTDLNLRFLPWLRRGLARSIQAGASANVTVNFSFIVGGSSVSKTLRVRSAGDVIGIDPAQIIRTDPRPNMVDFEPNYFPTIEFATPDLPWMFTPTAPDGDRLLPWLTLITVTEELVSIGTLPNAPLPVLTTPLSELPPDLNEMWAWAHVQSTELYATPADLSQALRDQPQNFLSRILSPRNLQPATTYIACLIPTFQAGVLAGMGLTVPEDVSQTLAWEFGDTRTEIQLPVYHSWSFTTGALGDFEMLVERLQPRELNETVGRHELDLLNSGIVAPKTVSLPKSTLFYGALVSPNAIVETPLPKTPSPRPTADPLRAAVYDMLTPEVVDTGGDYHYLTDDPVVTPPHYGSEQLNGAVLPPPKPDGQRSPVGYTPVWYGDVNSHPRTRGAAGLGVRIVRRHQEDFMARAWESVTELRSINQTLQQAVYASLIAERWQGRIHLLETGALLTLTRAAHTRILPSTKTIWGQLQAAAVPNGAVSSDMGRLTRSGSVVQHTLRLTTRAASIQHTLRQLVVEQPDRLVALSVHQLPAGAGLLSTGEAESTVEPVLNWYADALALQTDSEIDRINDLLVGGVRPAEQASTVTAVLNANQMASGQIAQLDELRQRGFRLSPQAQATRTAATALRNITNQFINQVAPNQFPPRAQVVAVRDAVRTFQSTLNDWSSVTEEQPLPPIATSDSLEPIAHSLSHALHATETISTHLQSRIQLSAVSWGNRPIPTLFTASPSFDEAVYPYVNELSPEYMLPGVGEIEPNTVGLVEVNGEFIEALLLGINHEMSREMRWREYPADLSNTWFKHFWTSTTPDIDEIKSWKVTESLGNNVINFADDMLVLLIKGDILQRYPNLAVYAVKAVAKDVSSTRRLRVPKTPEVQIFPAFSGDLGAGVKFFGFAGLDMAAALGDATPENTASDGGYFFAFQEQPSEPRFGLDETDPEVTYDQAQLDTWSELSWGHLVSAEYPDAPPYLTITGNFEDDPEKDDSTETSSPSSIWGSHAGAMARIVLQRPVRMLVHASAMLPEENTKS